MNIIGETIQNGEPSPEHSVEIENKTNILLAIEILKKLKTAKHHIQVDKPDGGEEIFELPYLSSIEQQAIETVLSELEKKEAIINEMAKQLVEAHGWFYSEFDNFTEKNWIDYFTKKVEGK